MSKTVAKRRARVARHARIREKVRGVAGRPRLSVYRSLVNIHAQLIDDQSGRTLAAASSLELKGTKAKKSEIAAKVGELIGQRAKEKGITAAVFDRGGALYQGRVKALADGARKAGLGF
jgi:large subunit ribosomal protein L18